MKKILLFLVLIVSLANFAQKKKTSKASKTPAIVTLTKADNLSMDLNTTDLVISIDNKTATKDTIRLAQYTTKTVPTECKIQSFTAKGTALYLVSWVENSKIVTKLSTEDVLVTNSVIINLANKTKVLKNKHLISDVAMIQYLDAKQTVSETVRKKHTEGFAFVLLPDGDILKKSKTKESRYMYSAADNAFVDFKKKK